MENKEVHYSLAIRVAIGADPVNKGTAKIAVPFEPKYMIVRQVSGISEAVGRNSWFVTSPEVDNQGICTLATNVTYANMLYTSSIGVRIDLKGQVNNKTWTFNISDGTGTAFYGNFCLLLEFVR